MDLPQIPYIPTAYEAMKTPRCTLWHAPGEAPDHLTLLIGLAEKAVGYLESTLRIRGERSLHLCCYRSHAEACVSLDRTIPPTMALAPFSDRTRGLVAVQSPGVAPVNGDPVRMFRILVHEFAHLLTMEATGSRKRLGDENRNMRIQAWLHEGVAEVCSLLAVDQDDVLDRCVRTLGRRETAWTFGDVNARLDDLDDRERALAFDRATGAVAWLAAWESLERVVARLRPWNHVLPAGLDCSIPTLCQAIGTGSARR